MNDDQNPIKNSLDLFINKIGEDLRKNVNQNVKDWYIDKTIGVGLQTLLGAAGAAAGLKYGAKAGMAALCAMQGVGELFKSKKNQ